MPPAKSLLWIAATLIAAFFAEAAIYRRGWYFQYVEPASSAGSVELQIYWLKHFRKRAHPEVLVVGDSRITEGFSAPQASAASGGRFAFWNTGIPGSSPRIWYYLLRDADPTRRRFRAIAIALDFYNDEDQYDNQAGHLQDLNYLVARLRAGDISDFAASMPAFDDRRDAFIGATLKGTVLAQDARLFLDNIPDRIARANAAREKGLYYFENYDGRKENLQGLTVDYAARQIHYPPGLDDHTRKTILDALLPDLPRNTGETTRYRKLWLGRILDMYRDSPTRIVFFECARGPLPQPERRGPQAFLDGIRNRPNVVILDQKAFRDFESPELFVDGHHYNAKGRELFTTRLTQLLSGVL
jgi:hypothetical protein